MNFTKLVLKRPVTTILLVLCLIFFGGMSLVGTKLELTPEINMPMLIITTTYGGASPEDINDLVTKPIEDQVGTLSGIDTMTSQSSENVSMIMLQYEYGTDMDNAYSDLRKKLDLAMNDLPDDADDPTIIEMDVNAMASMYLSVNNKAVNNIYDYTEKNIVPELEKLSAVASVDVSGGTQEYVRIRLIPEKLQEYHLDASTVAQLVGNADFSMPAGTTYVGNAELNISSGVDYKTPESYADLPITTSGGHVVYLRDIAEVSQAQEDATSIGRYDGADTVLVGLNRNQQYTAVDVSNQTKDIIAQLQAGDPNLQIVVVNDDADQIMSSLKSVFSTMFMAILISTVILFIFFGDVKASLIVATSIPLSILTAFIMMWAMGYSLNVITLSSVVLGVGMMVDNSTVILESCFRAMDAEKERSFKGYIRAALSGTNMVGASVLGSTLTTCVVFLPLGFLSGLSGQFFQPLGMTIVFCMTASLISAVSIVPMCYVFYRPKENEKAAAYKAIRAMQGGYRGLMEKLLRHKRLVMIVSVVLLVLSLGLAGQLKMVMMPQVDEGRVTISIAMKPNLSIEKQDETYRKIEAVVTADENTENYMLSSGGSMLSSNSATLTAYLKDDRSRSTDDTVKLWKDQLQAIDNADVSVESYSSTSSMRMDTNFNVTLTDSDYDRLKEVTDKITNALMQDNRVTSATSTLANASPLIKVSIDPVAAAAEGFTPAQLASTVNLMLAGKEADTMDVDGEELSIEVEYPKTEFNDINKVRNLMLTSAAGNTVALQDVADIHFEDSPRSITRKDKEYQAQITADFTALADASTRQQLHEQYVAPNLTGGVEEQQNTMDKMMQDEFTGLFQAIMIAVFLVFVVMAAQFESARFSFMVMTTVPFSLIGSFLFLWLFDAPISMPSLIGFLMLVGTVVNNGILYVDTVNQYKPYMPLEKALVEAGATRLRPILMTTLTTVVAMVPMAFGYGDSGELMQGLALVDVGGLTASTLMALLVLPIYYYYMNRGRKQGRMEGVNVDQIAAEISVILPEDEAENSEEVKTSARPETDPQA